MKSSYRPVPRDRLLTFLGCFVFLNCYTDCMKSKLRDSLAIAVDVGGTNLRVAIVDGKGKIIAKNVAKTVRKGKSGQAVTNQVISEIRKLIGVNSAEKYKGIGVSIAGPIDYKKGASTNPPNMNFSYVPIIGPLKKAFRLPVNLSNDCNAGALGEKYFGSGKKVKNLVYVTISSGIGGGAVVDGNLLLGKDGSAMEIGHMVVDTEYSLFCTCKKGWGHWEAYASGNSIPRFFRAWAKKKKINAKNNFSSAKDVFSAARRKDRVTLKFMKELGRINGRGLSNVIAAYDPELVILGGAVALNNGDLVLKYAKKNIDKFLRLPEIKISSLSENAPLPGAAALVFGYPHRSS